MAAPTLYLIDGSGFIFRAFYALPPMTRADGTPVNAVYGFCSMLQKLLNDLGATHIAVIFDAARKTFRNEIYPAYKAHRPPPPPELVPQFALIREATRAFGLPALDEENYEADDLIAAYTRQALSEGYDVRIVSSDKDLMQLVRDGVTLYDPMKDKSVGIAEVIEKFGVPPEKVPDVQALAGDSTDNIPGIPGIGLKTAAQLITDFGDLETLLSRASEIKQPKRRALLTEQAELARISKKLVTLDAFAPMQKPVAELCVNTDAPTSLIAFLQDMGFRSLIARITGASKPPASSAAQTTAPLPAPRPNKVEAEQPAWMSVEGSYTLVQDTATLKQWIDEATEQGFVAIDTETTSLTPSTTGLVGVSLALQAGRACYIPLAHVDPQAAPEGGFVFETPKTLKQIPLADCIALLKPLCADPSVVKIAHNLKFDSQVLGQHGVVFENYDDTMLMSYVLGAGLHGHGLDELAQMHFQHQMISFDSVTGTGRNRITFDRVPLDVATPYAAEDADYCLRLWLVLKPLIAQQNMARVYERLERPLVPVIALMERNGVRIDAEILRVQSQALALRMQSLEGEIHALAGHPFNLSSPKQMGEVLFQEMGLPAKAKGKNGAFGTGVEVLEPLADAGHVIAAKILDWRALSKLKSTYTDALPQQIDPHTQRVHTSFSMVGAATGRLSSTDPNLQNIPIRTEDGRAIRRAFIADDGHVLLSVDYSQIELRLAAEVAGIGALIQAFHDGVDIHALTASQVFGLPLAEVTSERRRQAKAINFGIIYGISGFGLAKQIDCSPGEANAFIRQYLDRFHELRAWMESTKEFARTHGYVETLFGRRVHLQGIHESNAARRAFAERQAINAPLQGTAADILKRAMIRLPTALNEAKLNAKLLLQVHDELVLEVPEAERDATIALVKAVMEAAPAPAITMKVPLVAEAGFAKNWAEAH